MTTPNHHKDFRHLGEPEPALIRGQLVDVDPKHGAAFLEAYTDSRIPLRFDDSFEPEMLKPEGKYVLVEGHGWISDEDRWIAVVIEGIAPPPPPRTIEEILNDPNPKFSTRRQSPGPANLTTWMSSSGRFEGTGRPDGCCHSACGL